MAMVVFSPGRPFASGISASDGTLAGNPRPPNSPSRSNGAAQKWGPCPTLTLPHALTATSAPTMCAIAGACRGRAQPALEVDGGCAEACSSRSQGKVGASRRGGGVAEIAIGREAAPVLVAAIEHIEQRGAAHDRYAHIRRSRNPRPRSRSSACTPVAASRPNAEPPERTTASTRSTVRCGSSRSVSRVPGAPPRTSTLATAGSSKMIAVTPEARRASSA